ncbi:MAG TPA: phage tail protein [Casimicrobiaceae bacterium]|nr:phage tail protein [Casimicrobiaceae bacterium]
MTTLRIGIRSTPFGNMRFRVEIEGCPGVGAVGVVFPEARIGGDGQEPHRARSGPLIVRRGLTRSRDWYAWWDAARNGLASRRSVRIVLQDSREADATGWLFEDALPVAYLLSPLDALGNEPVIETLELAVGRFTQLP